MALTVKQLAMECLRRKNVPMTPEEIWNFAVETGLNSQSSMKGKTPWSTIGANLYVSIKEDPESPFCIQSQKPTRFFLKDTVPDPAEEQPAQPEESKEDQILEKDLHKYLVSYVFSNENFRCYCKTINANKVSGKKKGRHKDMWVYPDIVGVHFPFDEQKKDVQDLLNVVNQNNVKVFSFEMKLSLNISNVRECYFQAISNSSWANEGYLVAETISSDARDELRSLNSSFGIGVIKLNREDPSQSEILFNSAVKESMDTGMVNRLFENTDFACFVKSINNGLKIGKPLENEYDRIIAPEE